MADTKKDTKKVKTDEKAAETIVDEVTAESADTAETTTTDVNVTETVDVPEEQAGRKSDGTGRQYQKNRCTGQRAWRI